MPCAAFSPRHSGARASFAGRGQPGDGVPGQGSKFNMEQALESVGLGPFQYILLAACGLAWMADAMEIILLSFLLDPLKKEVRLRRIPSPLQRRRPPSDSPLCPVRSLDGP